MKSVVLLSSLLLTMIFVSRSQASSSPTDKDKLNDALKEEIWALEEAYFTHLYKADYERVLAVVHDQFLGWPGAVPQPIDKEKSAHFMKQLIPKPTSCSCTIERAGIRLLGNVALTQYTLHVTFSDTTGENRTQSSRITHTWLKDGARWKILGGMSQDT